MPKWMWVALIGAIITFFVHKTSPMYAWIAGAITAAATFFFWRQG